MLFQSCIHFLSLWNMTLRTRTRLLAGHAYQAVGRHADYRLQPINLRAKIHDDRQTKRFPAPEWQYVVGLFPKCASSAHPALHLIYGHCHFCKGAMNTFRPRSITCRASGNIFALPTQMVQYFVAELAVSLTKPTFPDPVR